MNKRSKRIKAVILIYILYVIGLSVYDAVQSILNKMMIAGSEHLLGNLFQWVVLQWLMISFPFYLKEVRRYDIVIILGVGAMISSAAWAVHSLREEELFPAWTLLVGGTCVWLIGAVQAVVMILRGNVDDTLDRLTR